MSSQVQITLTAIDEASDVIENVGNTLNDTASQVENDAEQMSSATDTATEEISSDYDTIGNASNDLAEASANASSGLQGNAMAMNGLAMCGVGLFTSINNVENAQVALQRANVTVEKATNTVTEAQIAYNNAVAAYGPNSEEAQLALSKLQADQNALTVDQEREQEEQRNLTQSYLMAAVTVIPSVIMAVSSLTTLMPALSGAIGGVSDAMLFLEANPVVLVIAGIAALILVLVLAYEHCGPFRDAVNDVGSVISGAFMTALNAVSSALTTLWNDVLEPIATFLTGTFDSAFGVATKAANAFNTVINSIVSAAQTVSSVIGDLGSALSKLCFVHAAPQAEEFNKQITDSIKLSDQLTGKLGGLREGLGGVAAGEGGIAAPGGAGCAGVSASALAARAPTINISAPLVQIQGSADRTTAQLAAKMVQDSLKSIIIQPTSPHSGTHMMVRTGWQGV